METQIFTVRMQMLMRQWPVVWAANLTVQGMCAIILWPYYSHQVIMLWVVANWTLFTYRLWLRHHFERCVQAGNTRLRRWANQYVWSAIMGGLIWSSVSGLFFGSSDDPLTLLLLLILVGISVGALPALSSYYPAFWAFASAILIPTGLQLFTLEGQFADWTAMLTLTLLATTLFYSRRLDHTITAAITTDLRNQRLLADVSAAHQETQAANQSKSEFLASVSHDLRQPLHAMGLFLGSLGRQLNHQQQQDTLSHIQTAHDSLTKMFNALIEFSRLDSGTIQPVLTHFHLQDLLHDLANNFSQQAQLKGLELNIPASQAVIYSDRILLYGVLSNLLSNAVKYTDEGRVCINGDVQNTRFILHIQDTGCGIPEEAHQRIFSAYQQLDNPERDASRGLGLGLAMVWRTCQLLKLHLNLDSTPGQGSTFSLTLPQGQVSDLPATIDTPKYPQQINTLHIVIVDDNEEILNSMEGLLRGWGCLVTSATSARMARLALKQQTRPIDLIICDFRLRNQKTGVEAIEEIRTHSDPELPALMITGDTSPKLYAQLKHKGMYVLHKPIKPAQLKNAITALTHTVNQS